VHPAQFNRAARKSSEAVAHLPLVARQNQCFRPGGIFGSGGITPINILHEGHHNLTGLGDPALAQKLGLPQGSGSAEINPALHAHDCY
jgi:hypothetical protein